MKGGTGHLRRGLGSQSNESGVNLHSCPHLPSAEVLASAGEGEGNAAGAASSIRRIDTFILLENVSVTGFKVDM